MDSGASNTMLLVRTHRGEGLPATDPRSIESLVYMRVTEIGYDNSEENLYGYTTVTSDGILPVLIDGTKVVQSDQIIEYLQKYYCDLDRDLSIENQKLAQLFRKQVYNTLQPAYEFFLWGCGMDDPEFDSQSPSPFIQKWLARRRRAQLMATKFQLVGIATSDDAISQGVSVLHDLAVRLGQNEYFFGHSCMTSLDITVASIVAVIMTRKLPNGSEHPLAHTLKEYYPWLIRHMQGVLVESKVPHFDQLPENIYTSAAHVEPRLYAPFKGEIVVRDTFSPDVQTTGTYADEISPHVVKMHNFFDSLDTLEAKECIPELPQGTKILTLDQQRSPTAFADIVASLTKAHWKESVTLYPMTSASRYKERVQLSPEEAAELSNRQLGFRKRVQFGLFTFAGMITYTLWVKSRNATQSKAS